MKNLSLAPITHQGYNLFHQGQIAFAKMEHAGMKIDVEYLDRKIKETDDQVKVLSEQLRTDKDCRKVFKAWKRRYGVKTNLGSREQLGTILFDVLKIKGGIDTGKGRWRADRDILEDIDLPFVRKFTQVEKLKKAASTYLRGIRREVDTKGFLHPSFNLNTVVSYRPSVDSPNTANIPIRDDEMASLIRPAFIPRNSSRQIAEKDFSGIEVRVAGCYTKDPALLKYIRDPSTDMHRDQSMECYILKKGQVTKDIRSCTKGKFVFAEFYGDWWLSCARALWVAIDRQHLVTVDGVPLKKHLRSKGIHGLGVLDPDVDPKPGTFAYHIKEVERKFWKERFRKYDQWKWDWWNAYLELGYFDTYTGFRCSGVMDRKQAVNYPIQGCLAAESRVLTKDGLIPIKDLVGIHTDVWTGFRWAKAIGLDRGVHQRADIQLSSGIVIRCDTRHKLKNEKNEWVQFKDLQVGDYVALPRTSYPLDPSKDMNWWFVFGFILGDGCISDAKRKNVTIVGGKTKEQNLRDIHRFLQSQGYQDGKYGGVHFHKRKGKFIIWWQSKRAASFLESYGFKFGVTAHTKHIPEAVWKATPQQQRDFLEGLWKSDGARIQWQERNLGMCNKILLREVQILSASVGFDSHLKKTSEGWKLSFSWRGFNKKASRHYPKSAIHRQVLSIDLNSYGKLHRNQWITDKRNFLSGNDMTQYVGERIIEKNSNGAIYRYDTIEKITILPQNETTYTMSVDDPLHQFVADGVVHRNSAFHCLLWCLIRVMKLLRKYHMRTCLIGQIYDSLLADVAKGELKDYAEITEQVMTVDIMRHWSWIIVPLEAELEVAPPGKSWFEKAKVEF